MEREKFEESWKDAFDNAEVNPSEKVWTNIELDLEKAKGGDLKKRLFFYQMLAAASVVFAMAIGGAGYYYSFKAQPAGDVFISKSQDSAEATVESSRDEESRETGANTGKTETATSSTQSEHSNRNQRQTDVTESVQQKTSNDNQGNNEYFVHAQVTKQYAELPLRIDDRGLPQLYTPREVRLNIPDDKEEIDPVIRMLAQLEQREREISDKDKNNKKAKSDDESLWTSIGFAAGSFNTMQASAPSGTSRTGTSSMAALAAPIVDQESKATGYSYSMGVNVGTKISERWVVQGGVNYLTHSSEYTSNNIVMEGPGSFATMRFRPAATNEVVNADANELSNKIVPSAPYSVNNNMRYLSIPMQAGYLIVNKTFGLQLNAGVATDLFLQNTVEGAGDQLDKTSQPGGSESPYRTVNLSGLFGTEVSYRFGPHYRISINPGLRYPFNTIYKSEIGVQSTPLTFDVGLRFRYIFH